MLEIRKGIADKSYENTFFREFAKNLNELFEDNSLDGLLIGHPKCNHDSSLEIDALLVTKHVVCIIDFKNVGGKIKIPRGEDYQTQYWFNENDQPIMAGSEQNFNPYRQIERQKNKFVKVVQKVVLKKLLKPNLFDPFHTVKIVCFQKRIELNTEISPDKELNFFIMHQENYLEKIMDILKVKDPEVNLSVDSFNLFTDEFQGDPFNLTEIYVTKTEKKIKETTMKSWNNFWNNFNTYSPYIVGENERGDGNRKVVSLKLINPHKAQFNVFIEVVCQYASKKNLLVHLLFREIKNIDLAKSQLQSFKNIHDRYERDKLTWIERPSKSPKVLKVELAYKNLEEDPRQSTSISSHKKQIDWFSEKLDLIKEVFKDKLEE